MAQEVQYNEKCLDYTEGPFIIARHPLNFKWRIEVQQVGKSYPGPPDYTVYDFCRESGVQLFWFNQRNAIDICNWLNMLVHAGRIQLQDNVWKPVKS